MNNNITLSHIMTMRPEISVIVPLYNVGLYVGECLESIRCQTYADFEVLLVDDGSDDGTLDICRGIESADRRFRVFHNGRNCGQSVARNIGLDEAVGKYITFIDGDDRMHPKYLENLITIIKESGADIASVGYTTGRLFKKHRRVRKVCEYVSMSRREALRAMLYRRRFDSNVWGKLFRRDIFDNMRFSEGMIYEDLDLMARMLMTGKHVECVAVINDKLYFYRRRQGSTLSVFNARRLDVLGITARVCMDMPAVFPDLIAAADNRRFGANYNMLLLMARHNAAEYKNEIVNCSDVIKRLRSKVMRDSNSRFKNRAGALLSYVVLMFVGCIVSVKVLLSKS